MNEERVFVESIPPFASSLSMRATDFQSDLVALPGGVVRPLHLPARLLESPVLKRRRNHRGSRSHVARERRFVSYRDRFACFRESENIEVDEGLFHDEEFVKNVVEESFEPVISPNGDVSRSSRSSIPFTPAAVVRESTPQTAVASGFTFLNANVRAIRRKSAEITRLIERSDHPTFLVFTETWLDKSLEEFRIPGYVEVSRQDRGRSSRGGGVMVFSKVGFEHAIVHVGDSSVAERSWHIIHSNRGPILFGAWYRPPTHGEIASIESLDEEIANFGGETLGTILLGDMNVHEEGWLRFSDGTSIEGRLLRDVACSHGWEERVRKPTRGQHLLDLVLTDFGVRGEDKGGAED